MSTPEQPTEAELRAAYEEEIKRIRIEHVLLDNVVTLVNLGMRRTGLMPGTESERDVGQVQLAIESVRALMPLLEGVAPEQGRQVRDALSQLQLAYVQIGGAAPGSGADPLSATGPAGPAASDPGRPPAPEPASSKPPASKPGEPGPAQSSGRLWIPGQ